MAGADGDSKVWSVDPDSGVVSQMTVKVDRLSPYGVVVTEGLTPGQWIVTAGVNSLTEGQQVRILDQP